MQNRFLINPHNEYIPDMGLDRFIVGYTTGRSTYNKKMLWWLFFVGPGFIVVLIYSLIYKKRKTKELRYLVHNNGFIMQSLSRNGEVHEQRIVDFRDVDGISFAETDEFVYAGGFGRYNGTQIWLSVIGKDGRGMLKGTTTVKNLYREANRYDFKAYAFLAIMEAWQPHAQRNYDEELRTKGYATFYSQNNVVQIGDNFLKVNNQEITPNFVYHTENGILFLKYQTSNETGTVERNLMVSVNYMCNKELFYKAFQDFFDAKDGWKLTSVRETDYAHQQRFLPIPFRPLQRFN